MPPPFETERQTQGSVFAGTRANHSCAPPSHCWVAALAHGESFLQPRLFARLALDHVVVVEVIETDDGTIYETSL